MSASPTRIALTKADYVVISQAVNQAAELDGVFMADFRDQAIPLSLETIRKLRTLIGWQKMRIAVMAKLSQAADLAAEHATATITVDLGKDEARTVAHAILASVDFDDDRIAGTLVHLGEGGCEVPGSETLIMRDILAGRNAARLAILGKLYGAAGIELISTPTTNEPP